MRIRIVLLIAAVVLAQPLRAAKLALLVGIDDYTASRLQADKKSKPVPGRDWPNLDGAVNDIRLAADLLVAVHGFRRTDIVTLTDQQATRGAILTAIRKLGASARRGDVVVFYYSGHGSQVRNTASRELDKMDESLVPADSRLGAPDIRDKELRIALDTILDRNAQLTVILDSCHSASGTRGGIEGGRTRRLIKADPRDVAKPDGGASLKDRGALVIAAAQDFDYAYETLAGNKIRGAFSWALARAIRDADRDEPASDTFLRAQALLRDEMPGQVPVLAGTREACLRPLFGGRVDRRDRVARIAIDKDLGGGKYSLLAGWANGLTEGSELRVRGRDESRLKITRLDIGRAEAEVIADRATRGQEARTLDPGTMLELARWVPPEGPRLRVWIPIMQGEPLVSALRFGEQAAHRHIRWITDPVSKTPMQLVRWRDASWELVANGRRQPMADSLESLPAEAPLFVQFPVTPAIAADVGEVEGVERVAGPENADYILVGRWAEGALEYAWIRPLASEADVEQSAMPLRSRWTPAKEAGLVLRDDLLRLRRLHGWHHLASPSAEGSPYRLVVRSVKDEKLVQNGALVGGQKYRLVLQARPNGGPVFARFYYVFIIDSAGNSTLLFPLRETDSVGNRLPITNNAAAQIPDPPKEIELRDPDGFVVEPPYGLDTYVLLSTDEPLPTPGSLEWRGVRAPSLKPTGALETLLRYAISGKRATSEPMPTPAHWSIERIAFRSASTRGAS